MKVESLRRERKEQEKAEIEEKACPLLSLFPFESRKK